LLIIGVWQLTAPLIGSRLLPMPVEVIEEIWVLAVEGTIWSAFATSLLRLAIGLALAFVVGGSLGLLLGISPRAEAFAHDFIVIGLTFPYLIWGILVSMWFGFGDVGPILVVFIAALPFFAVNISEGVRDVSRDLLDVARSYRVPRSRLLRHLVIPSLSPFLFAGLRYGLANGWKGLVLAEVFAATSGAGWEIAGMRDIGNAAGVVAYAVYFATFSILVERLVFGRLSAWVFRWRPEESRTASADAT
jgi:NitT/TauT family transport system permease protein